MLYLYLLIDTCNRCTWVLTAAAQQTHVDLCWNLSVPLRCTADRAKAKSHAQLTRNSLIAASLDEVWAQFVLCTVKKICLFRSFHKELGTDVGGGFAAAEYQPYAKYGSVLKAAYVPKVPMPGPGVWWGRKLDAKGKTYIS